MAITKDLGKIVDEGDYIAIQIPVNAGRYRIKIKPASGGAIRERTVTVKNDGDFIQLVNYNGRKSLELGKNFLMIYRIEANGLNRIEFEGANRFGLFLVPSKDVIDLIDGNTIKLNFGNDTFLLRIVSHHNESVHSLQIEKL